MSKKESAISQFLIACIASLAEQQGISNADAYQYLNKYAGMDFLFDEYDVEHTLSIENAVADAVGICQCHGGELNHENQAETQC